MSGAKLIAASVTLGALVLLFAICWWLSRRDR